MRLINNLSLFLIFLLILSSCSYQPEPFRVGTDIWIGYEPLYLADNLGYYKETPIRLVTMHNASEVSHALRSGMLEVAALTLDEALSIKQDGFDIKIILVMDISNGGDVLISNQQLTTLADLRGKRVGVDSGAVGAVMLDAVLKAANLIIDDIKLVHLTVDQHEKAYKDGLIDAVVTFEPVRTKLISVGAHVLFDSSQISGRIVDVLVTTSTIASVHKENLDKLISGHFQALKYLQKNRLKAAQKMVIRQGISAEEIVKSYQGIVIPDLAKNHQLLRHGSPELKSSAKQLTKLMLKERLLSKPVILDEMFDNQFLPTQ
ncbi:MAG: ABC transporter substrate-binding protein [gamma proteobacterium symbiont of Taylorina sp.]|nr:ABC transporter substrate-binding protein [gamma proteobacterium symbiont of Taylorina sp.]